MHCFVDRYTEGRYRIAEAALALSSTCPLETHRLKGGGFRAIFYNGAMAEFRTRGHAVWDIKYHLAWITKYRCKVLRGGGEGARPDPADLPSAGGVDRARSGIAGSRSRKTVSEYRMQCLGQSDGSARPTLKYTTDIRGGGG